MMLDLHDEKRSKSYMHAAVGVVVAGFFAGLIIKVTLALPGATSNPCPVMSLCGSAGELLIGDSREVKQAPACPAQYGGKLPELNAAAAARVLDPGISDAEAAKVTSISDVKLIGKCIYTHYNIPFVILGFALLSGSVGAVALARKIRKD